jgi:hypothetical protein
MQPGAITIKYREETMLIFNKSILNRLILVTLYSTTASGVANATTPPAQPYITDAATQLLYHFDEPVGSAGARDYSGQERNATHGTGVVAGNAGQTFFTRAMQASLGNSNRAFWKDTGAGTSSFLYSAASADFTIEGWFKLSATTNLATHPAMLFGVQPDNDTDADYQLYIKPGTAANPLSLVFRDRQRFLAYTSTLTWTTGVWYHIAIVATVNSNNTTTYTLYRTAAGDNSADVVVSMDQPHLTQDTSTADRVFSVGNLYGNNGNDFFEGSIDEIRFSTVARSPADFQLTLGPTVQQRIRAEALASNIGDDVPEHALPLMGSWNGGNKPYFDQIPSVAATYDYTPAWQVAQVEAGHHLLPWFVTPDPELQSGNWFHSRAVAYYEDALETADEWDLPISFVGAWNRGDGACSQWECYLFLPKWSREDYTAPTSPADVDYLALTGSNSPNMIRSDATPITYGSTRSLLSAFGATLPWEEVGSKWGSGPAMVEAQSYYAQPPKVLFVSNNESPKQTWSANAALAHCGSGGTAKCEVAIDQHYISGSHTLSDIIEDTGNGWIERYGLMHASWLAELSSDWAGVSSFIGYGALGPTLYGRTSNWNDYALAYDNGGSDYRIDPAPLSWNGGSPELYDQLLNTGNGKLGDSAVMSVQVEGMNLVFMRDEAYRLNPEFWFELSVWNGCDSIDSSGNPTCTGYTSAYTAERYAGWVRFAMWMLQPRLLRDYRNYSTEGNPSNPNASTNYFAQVLAAVDQVYADATLQLFWRDSKLVAANPADLPVAYNYYQHPYQAATMSAYAGVDRMFMLPVAENTAFNSALSSLYAAQQAHTSYAVPLNTAITVFAMARVRGEAPKREWLLYLHAPAGAQTGVTVTIPGYSYNNGAVTVNAPVGGKFYLVKEDGNSVNPL